MRSRTSLMTAAAVVAITAASPAGAQGQDQRGPDVTGGTGSETDDAFNGIPDIVVTANRVAQPIQRAGSAISVQPTLYGRIYYLSSP